MRTIALAGAFTLLFGCGGGTAITPAAPFPAFDGAVNLGPPLNSQDFDGGPSISADGISLYFVTDRDVSNGGDIWVASRRATAEPFSKAESLGAPVNSSADEGAPTISADGLELFFDRAPDGLIFGATRSNISEPFRAPVAVDLRSTGCCDEFPNISADGLDLYFCSNRPGGYGGDDVWVATRTTGLSRFDPPANLGPTVNSPANDCDPSISKDDRVLLIASDRKGGKGGLDIWVATRSSRSQPFGKPVNLGANVNSGFSDRRPDISADGLTLYFMSDRVGGTGSFDLWQAKRA